MTGGRAASAARAALVLLGDLAPGLRESARRESSRRRMVWVGIAVVLALAPVVFNLSRSGATAASASVELFPRPVGPFPAPQSPDFYQRLLTDPELRAQMRLHVGATDYRAVTLRRDPARGTVVVTATADSPERARDVVSALGPQLAGASGRRLTPRLPLILARIRSRLHTVPRRGVVRRRLERRLNATLRLHGVVPDLVVLGPVATAERSTAWADRLATALPGDTPRRRSPVWAGFAGLLLASGLWASSLALATPGAVRLRAPQWLKLRGDWPRTVAPAAPLTVPRGLPGAILGLSAPLAVVAIMVAGRDLSTFRLDEWSVVVNRQGNSLDEFLSPHNGHLCLLPILVFKGLLATVGMEPYWPYRLIVAVLSVLIGLLVYLYARPRLGSVWALVPALLTMVIGQGGYDIVWPWQIGFDTSVACGVGMLLCFDRPGARSDLIAGGLLLLALCSSSIGIAVAVAAIVGVLASPGERRARALRILALPLLAYGAWWLHYRPSETFTASLADSLRYAVDVSGAAVVGLFGVTLSLRQVLAVGLVAAVVVGLVRRGTDRRALLVACTLPVAYWILLIIARGALGEQLDSRYMLPGSVFVACILSEVLRGWDKVARPWMVGVAVLFVALASMTHVRFVSDIANFEVAERSEPMRAEIAAVSLAARAGPVDTRLKIDAVRAGDVFVGAYLKAERRFGPAVADPEAAIVSSGPTTRAAADRTYVAAARLRPVPAGGPVEARAAGCRRLRGPVMDLVLPRGGLAIRPAGRSTADVAVDRWGPEPVKIGAVSGPGWWRLPPLGPDAARAPLRARLSGPSSVLACPLPD